MTPRGEAGVGLTEMEHAFLERRLAQLAEARGGTVSASVAANMGMFVCFDI